MTNAQRRSHPPGPGHQGSVLRYQGLEQQKPPAGCTASAGAASTHCTCGGAAQPHGMPDNNAPSGTAFPETSRSCACRTPGRCVTAPGQCAAGGDERRRALPGAPVTLHRVEVKAGASCLPRYPAGVRSGIAAAFCVVAASPPAGGNHVRIANHRVVVRGPHSAWPARDVCCAPACCECLACQRANDPEQLREDDPAVTGCTLTGRR